MNDVGVDRRLREKSWQKERRHWPWAGEWPQMGKAASQGELKGRLTHTPRRERGRHSSFDEYYSFQHINLDESGLSSPSSDHHMKRHDQRKGRFSYLLSFLCGADIPNKPLFVEPWWAVAECPVCSVPFQESDGEQFCSKCGLSLKYEIPDSFTELAVKARLHRKYMKAAGGQIYMFTEPVFCSEHKERVMQKLASDYIDYRIVTLLKNVGGSIQQSDIPLEYEKSFTDNDNGVVHPAVITPAKVRASIKRLHDKGKVRVIDNSTTQGKRNIVELIDPETLRRIENASRTIKIAPCQEDPRTFKVLR